jgi:hypothetical protein
MNPRVFLACIIAASIWPTTSFSQSFLSQYKGSPYHDTRYSGGPQKIPGKVLCAYYDLGGEGVAYHDTDPKNHGSGELNPADGTYLNEFRILEGVDTSYTKFLRKPDPVDDNPFDKVAPPADLLYVGWTEPGEWFNLTVDVANREHTRPISFTLRIVAAQFQSMRMERMQPDLCRSPQQMIRQTRLPGVSGTTGIWLRNFSKCI